MSRILCKSNSDKVLSGVCGGIAEYFGFNPTTLRILVFLFMPATFWPYIALLILMPSNNLL